MIKNIIINVPIKYQMICIISKKTNYSNFGVTSEVAISFNPIFSDHCFVLFCKLSTFSRSSSRESINL